MADKTFVAVLMVLISSVLAQQDNSVCTAFTPGPKDPALPVIPDYYEVHTECNIKNRHFTSDFHEWYDKKNQRIALHIHTGGVSSEEVYNFPTNELFHIDRQMNTCTVKPITSAKNLDLFGQTTNSGNASMFTAAGALHFTTKYPQKWINKTMVRGVMCNLWRSCQYWPERNATMVVDWYFSTPDWLTATINSQVPVRAHVTGTVWEFGKPRKFQHTYEFADFTTTRNDQTVFETPQGVYCPMRKNTRPLPTPAAAFHFTAEIVDLDSNAIAFIKEWYNYDLKLVRYDYTPTTPVPYGMNLLTEVHDFNTGVAYTIDTVRGNCSATSISKSGFDTRNADPAHVRIRSSKEFFYFDKTAYTYEGTRAARDLLTDVWIAQRNDWPAKNSGINSTWEWYFASGNYVTNLPDTLKFGMPVMMTLHAGLGQNYVYNIYDYDERRPEVWSYDISKCYGFSKKKDLAFKIQGNYRQVAASNLREFKYATLRAISIAGSSGNYQLSSLRIYNIQVDYADGNDILVQFTLLDKAPKIGNVVNPKPEQDLNTVKNLISGAINGGQLIVRLVPPKGTSAVAMVARPYSLTPTQRVVKNSYYTKTQQGPTTSTGTSGGAMAGMGVALLVVFFIMGVAATYMFYRRQGGAFLPKKFDNTDITKDDS